MLGWDVLGISKLLANQLYLRLQLRKIRLRLDSGKAIALLFIHMRYVIVLFVFLTVADISIVCTVTLQSRLMLFQDAFHSTTISTVT